jgi:hypothetical protein
MHLLRSSRRFAVERGTSFFKGLLRRSNIVFLWPAFLAFLFSSGSCDESLPAYVEPSRLFDAAVHGGYALTIIDNSMKVFVTVTNIFDETLQAPALIEGEVDIVSVRDPGVRKTFLLTRANVTSALAIDPYTGVLTIDAGATVNLMVSWDLIDDTKRDLRRAFFKYVDDPSCSARCLAYPEDFVITGYVQLLDRTGPVLFGPVVYSFCHVSHWINPKDCPPIIVDEPCSVRAPRTGSTCYPFPDTTESVN